MKDYKISDWYPVLVDLRKEYARKLRAVDPRNVRMVESLRGKMNVLHVAIARLTKAHHNRTDA